jgi:hypothetical protein
MRQTTAVANEMILFPSMVNYTTPNASEDYKVFDTQVSTIMISLIGFMKSKRQQIDVRSN